MSGMGEVDKLLDTLDIRRSPTSAAGRRARPEPADLTMPGRSAQRHERFRALKPTSEPAQETGRMISLAAASPQAEEPNFADDLDAPGWLRPMLLLQPR